MGRLSGQAHLYVLGQSVSFTPSYTLGQQSSVCFEIFVHLFKNLPHIQFLYETLIWLSLVPTQEDVDSRMDPSKGHFVPSVPGQNQMKSDVSSFVRSGWPSLGKAIDACVWVWKTVTCLSLCMWFFVGRTRVELIIEL